MSSKSACKKAPLPKTPKTPQESHIASHWVVYLESRADRLFPEDAEIENLQDAWEYLRVLWIMDKKWRDYTPEYLKWPYPDSGDIIIPIVIEYYISYRNENSVSGIKNNQPLFVSGCDDFGLVSMLLGDNRPIIKAARACMH